MGCVFFEDRQAHRDDLRSCQEAFEPADLRRMFSDIKALHYESFGPTERARPIELFQLTRGSKNLLLIGGVHGDEPEGFFLVEEFVRSGLWRELEGSASLWVIPRLNPDGCAANRRVNERGVDLNRNMPTKDWDPVAHKERYQPGPKAGSELETQVLMQVIERLAPHAIISMHTWEPMINYNGPARSLAEAMAAENKYIITDNIGYPTPGSLGTWAGWERNIPTITLEIERDSGFEATWRVHKDALLAGLLFASVNDKLG
jgi:murein peptide amidase A